MAYTEEEKTVGTETKSRWRKAKAAVSSGNSDRGLLWGPSDRSPSSGACQGSDGPKRGLFPPQDSE